MSDKKVEIPGDDIFVFNVSQDMGVRNTLRAGLYEAQKGDDSKIPVFVSWPEWLEDGIVCMYAKDYAQVLRDTVQRAALATDTLSDSGTTEPADATPAGDGSFQAMNPVELEHIESPQKESPNE